MLSDAPQQVKGLACTGLVEMSFSGRSDQAGLAGWGASACQHFIGGLNKGRYNYTESNNKSFHHVVYKNGCMTLEFCANDRTLNSATSRVKLETHKSIIKIIRLLNPCTEICSS